MKTVITSLLLFLGALAANAQDIIIKNDKSEIKCRVTEIAETVVKYKKWENLEGPTYSVSKSEVFMIRYENGTTETFDSPKKEEPKEAPETTPKTMTEKVNKYGLGFSTGFFNPNFIAFRGVSDASSGFTFHFTWSSLPSEEKWLSTASRIYFMNGTVTNYDNDKVDLSIFGYGVNMKVNANYIHKKDWSIYAGLGVGYLAGSVTPSDPNYSNSVNFGGFAYQIDLFGYQTYHKHFGSFMELGIGSEGLVKCGVQYCW